MTGVDLGISELSDFQQIGTGGFSTVFSAWDEGFRRRVAVKMLHSLDDAGRRRFERERGIMGQLSSHPNVIMPFRAGYTSTGAPYLVMELVEDGSLQDLVGQRGPIPWQEALDYIIPATRALGHAHEQGILHRDVKPGNLLLSGRNPKLTDFGIAAIRESTASIVGYTLSHCPPETFAQGTDSRDDRSDLYSMASTLYTLLSGKPPYDVEGPDSQQAYMFRIIDHDVPELPATVSAPPALRAFLRSALSKDPAQRPPTADDFIAQLREIQGAPTTIDPLPSVDPSVSGPPPGTSPWATGETELNPPVGGHGPPPSTGERASEPTAIANPNVVSGPGTGVDPADWPAPHPSSQPRPETSVDGGITRAASPPTGLGTPTSGPGQGATGDQGAHPFARTPDPTGSIPIAPHTGGSPLVDAANASPRANPKSRKSLWIVLGLALVLALGVGGAAVALSGNGDETPALVDDGPAEVEDSDDEPDDEPDDEETATAETETEEDDDGAAPDVVWEFETESALSSRPEVSGGVLVIGTQTTDTLYALDADTGEELWSFEAGGSITGDPVIDSETVYIGSAEGVMYAFDLQDGTVIWEASADGPIIAGALVTDEAVIVGTETGSLYSFSRQDGVLDWTAPLGGMINSAPVLASQGGEPTIVIGTTAANLYLVDPASGESIDNVELRGGVWFSTPLVLDVPDGDGQEVWFGTSTEQQGFLYRVRLDDLDADFLQTSLGVGTDPALTTDGLIVVGNDAGELLAVNRVTIGEVWREGYADSTQIKGSPAVFEETVIFGTHDRELIAVTAADGAEVWRFEGEQIFGLSAPIVVDNQLYVGNDSGTVYRFDL